MFGYGEDDGFVEYDYIPSQEEEDADQMCEDEAMEEQD
jgi:hypothetical protein